MPKSKWGPVPQVPERGHELSSLQGRVNFGTEADLARVKPFQTPVSEDTLRETVR